MSFEDMWDGATRDLEAEKRDLSRTAALEDASDTVWALVAQAASENDLEHRLVLADGQIRTIAESRDYPADDLVEDLRSRWKLLAEARRHDDVQTRPKQTGKATASRQAQEAYLQAVAKLTARAAADNPDLPVQRCQELAEAALAKHADANPLMYESWGGSGDGPVTQRAKGWQPPGVPPRPTHPPVTWRPPAAPPPAPNFPPVSWRPPAQPPSPASTVPVTWRPPGASSPTPAAPAPSSPAPNSSTPAGWSSPSASPRRPWQGPTPTPAVSPSGEGGTRPRRHNPLFDDMNSGDSSPRQDPLPFGDNPDDDNDEPASAPSPGGSQSRPRRPSGPPPMPTFSGSARQ